MAVKAGGKKARAPAKKVAAVPAEFERVVAAFARRKDVRVEPGWGVGNVALKVKGKIFAMSVRGDLVAKLPKERVDELVVAKKGVRFDPRRNGQVMKEWAVVPPSRASEWIALAKEAYAFVGA